MKYMLMVAEEMKSSIHEEEEEKWKHDLARRNEEATAYNEVMKKYTNNYEGKLWPEEKYNAILEMKRNESERKYVIIQ